MSELARSDEAPVEFATHLSLEPELIEALRRELADVAHKTVVAIMAEVPAYRAPFIGRMGQVIEDAVKTALDGFLRLAARGPATDASTPMNRATQGAHQLGVNEARAGRSAEALLAAYRVGARVSWRELSASALAHGAPADSMANFAELVFAYIDHLSASSVRGHNAELTRLERDQARHTEHLVSALLRGEPLESLKMLAQRAGWRPSKSLTAVVIGESQAGTVLTALGSAVLQSSEELPRTSGGEEQLVLLVPDQGGAARRQLLAILDGRDASVGPARPWHEAHVSYQRALRGRAFEGQGTIDTDALLPELVLSADPTALADLRERVLAPLEGLRPGPREKLEATLRAWINHQGRREDAADFLQVHAQTVRYRMSQLRDLYGDSLDDPDTLFALTLALGRPRP